MKRILTLSIAALLLAGIAAAHVGSHPSVHDAMAGLLERLRNELDADALRTFDEKDALAFITEDERHVFGTQHWTFTVDKPVVVYVARHSKQRETPFWLPERGFKETKLDIEAGERTYEVWEKDFDAGEIGLGINGFRVHPEHYFVVVAPQKRKADVKISDVYPGRHRRTTCKAGASIYMDESDEKIEALPKELEGQILLRGIQERAWESQIVHVFRMTPYPASTAPDQVVLTWSGDPKTTQTVQWRTSPEVTDGVLRYRKAGNESASYTEIAAAQTTLLDKHLGNDAVNHRFTAIAEGLEAATSYTYTVGSTKAGTWSEAAEFTTAPDETVPFTFIYMGDAQNGLDTWGTLVHEAHKSRPGAAFYIMAGDLVNRGNERDDWDSFFHNATGIYDRKQLVPAIGNHEDQGNDGPWMYLELFDLPKDGPPEIDPERAYAFEYSNALFVILDTNLSPKKQTAWLEAQLKNSTATWKFVVYHHPAYSSAPRRDNPVVRKQWGPLFDSFHVDVALQGHDHAYLRSYPMKDGKRVASPAEGTIYIVSVSGTKYYDQDPREYTEFGMTNTSTYQVLDILIDGGKLTYRAFDVDGNLRDEFVIEK